MKHSLSFVVSIVMLCLLGICSISCNSGQPNKTASADTTKGAMPKMSAKERLAKNNILERHDDWPSMHLLGKVKTFSQTTYKFSDKGDKEMERKDVDSFNPNGKIAVSAHSWMMGKKMDEWKDIMKYDASGNDTAVYGYDADGKYTHRSIGKYDSRGNNIEDVTYDANGKEMGRERYIFDDKDNLIELNFGQRGENWVYKYDENGFVTEGETFDSTGKSNSKHARKYDDKGNELNFTAYKNDGTINGSDTMKYDENGHKIEDDGYDEHGKLKLKETMKYDDKGHRTELTVYKPDGSMEMEKTTYHEYEYDAIGNITKDTTLKMKGGRKIPVNVTESEYVYY